MGKDMRLVEAELERVRREIVQLKIEEATYERLLQKMASEQLPAGTARVRSPNVKPMVLSVMHQVAAKGATSSEVDEIVRQNVPTVGKDTVASVLSRLKGDGALVFDGERYYEKQFAPDGGTIPSIRVIK